MDFVSRNKDFLNCGGNLETREGEISNFQDSLLDKFDTHLVFRQIPPLRKTHADRLGGYY